MPAVLTLLFAFLGLLVGAFLNVLADDLPRRARLSRPHCPQCNYSYRPAEWLAIGRFLLGRRACPQCGLVRWRPLLVEIATALAFALLTLLFDHPISLLLYTYHVAVLILIIVIDLEHRLILHAITFPSTLIALAGSFFLKDGSNTPLAALLGLITGFLIFYGLYLLGQRLFGPGALGFGDVTLSMTLGAMLGLHRIIFALVLGILLGGLISVLLIASGRFSLRSRVAYGPFLAVAGLIMIGWGREFLQWYLAP
jgi:leader peptidase (prepilin peptidase) / N-methyltransferase